MSSINLFAREISIKVVYYGPGLGGKTSSLQYIHRALRPDSRGQLVSLATGTDRTLYFDFLPVKLPKLRGYAIRVQLYTVPGQVHYNATRQLVLGGVDGIVFVADSQRDREAANLESFENLRENLEERGLRLAEMPLVLQYNKRDCEDVLSVAELDEQLNGFGTRAFETVATTGHGVFDALKAVTTLVLSDLRRRGLWDGGDPQARPASRGFETATAEAAGGEAGEGESIAQKLQALSEAGDALSEMEPVFDGRITIPGVTMPRPAPSVPPRGPALSDLLPPGDAREAVVAVEAELDRGDFAQAIRLADRAFADAASAADRGDEGPLLHALMLGLPGDRYLRFREAARRADGGAVSSDDALFALFFLVDAALRG